MWGHCLRQQSLSNTFFSRFGTVEVSMKRKRNSFTKSLKDLNGKEGDRKTSQFTSGIQCEITFYSDWLPTPSDLCWFDGNSLFWKLHGECVQIVPREPRAAADEWEWFTDLFFFGYGRPIPYWPQYIQIQRRLGRLDEWDDSTKGLRKQVRQKFRLVFNRLSQKYPRWGWAVKQKCFLQLLRQINTNFSTRPGSIGVSRYRK